jgi:histidine triad (HIT) family protein
MAVLSASCIFCKIIQGTVPSTIIAQNEHVMAIQDIAPKAPIHYLILPKKHTESLIDLSDQDIDYGWHMITMARDLGNQLSTKAFNLVVNNGEAAGQLVPHLHFSRQKSLYSWV